MLAYVPMATAKIRKISRVTSTKFNAPLGTYKLYFCGFRIFMLHFVDLDN